MANPGAAPARLGRYELIARLATGGMGEIFLARMEGAAGFEKLFVIKRILPHLADDVRFRDMLIAEARIASMMTHANICQVYELGETDGQLYIVMEYLEGTTLLPLLRKRSKEAALLDLGFVGGVIQQVTDGLHYAHELKDRGGAYLGIVHRDVTPSNLFLTDAGIVKVLDFGIAKVKDASAHTQTGTVKGKYAYMSPEQLRGAAVDRRSDVFALGVVVYEMLALRRLFQRKTDYLTFRAVMEQPIIDVRHYRPDCPDPLAAVLARALDRDPANRFETSRQLGSAVLDAITAIKRPWTQGEISDFVTGQFADEIRKRSAQIASVVHGGVGPQALALLAESDEPQTEVEDDYEFPEVDSAVAGTPADGRPAPAPRAPRGEDTTALGPAVAPIQVRRPTGEQPASFYEPTESSGYPAARRKEAPGPAAPRTEIDARSGAPGVVAPAPSPPVVVINPRRSLVWPLLAIAMVAVAGGALFLVWQQTQNQGPTSVVITNSAEGRARDIGSNVIVLGGDPDEPGADPGDPGADPAQPAQPAPDLHGGSAPRPPEPRRRQVDPYVGVVRAKRVEANRCVTEHGNPPPGTRVLIVVAPDGHPRNVTVKPVSVDTTPLATCIKGVFRGATFPRGDGDHELEVKLVPPA